MEVVVRREQVGDAPAIERLVREAFGGEYESRLVGELCAKGYDRLSLVAEASESIVGHALFSELSIINGAQSLLALALAPLAVQPAFQRQGIGARLVREGLAECARVGHAAVIVLGEPAYYRRFGFDAALVRGLQSPFSGAAFMGIELRPGALREATGAVRYPPPFGV